MLAAADYGVIVVLIAILIAVVVGIMLLTHLIGPKRFGEIKDSTYESGVTPFGDTRRRFNVRFYVVAILFMVFDVEIVFFYPWATVFPQLTDPNAGEAQRAWRQDMISQGFGPGYFLGSILIFTALLLVGFAYEWKKGIFKWDSPAV